ncbi:MAG: hypothetical protein M1819_000513 [Sarea resinae]|nr:MAG: hypothetical protein M1819_000513 [Sarea resinae]
MLYGKPNELYERAVRTHVKHGQKLGYPVHVLRQEITGGYWNKPAYILSLVVNELAKPPGERTQWLMWVDADSIIINQLLPVEIFLPPEDFSNVHFIGNKDQNGLNTGIFFIHVHEWSVRMLTKAMAFPMFHPDIDLGVSMDQVAMAYVFNETEFRSGVLYQPRPWFNTYEFHHGYEGKKGDLLVHFPGLEDDRWRHMSSWLTTVETKPHEWDMELEKTTYPELISNYWKDLRDAREALITAEKIAPDYEDAAIVAVNDAYWTLRNAIEAEADRMVAVTTARERLVGSIEAMKAAGVGLKSNSIAESDNSPDSSTGG